ncbi:MAG: DNA mismatch repair endonuclease MutL [Candidatus Omnitrophica bacterium]|nr:DNA mismatch repair endonuclease MutL [Candidatus Omnitrophota bacterium]
MGKIKILAQNLADKIAAGEVVERPASVVKELLENALDAGSTGIEIIVENAGCTLIKIIDDGQGMDAEDLQKAVLRHATSKISEEKDLFGIKTLGFRGEALASIAAVSFLTINSCAVNENTGWQISIEGGAVKKFSQTARTQGTTVEVRNLFFNTPARLKFLKSDATEMINIVRQVSELALAYPGVSFKLVHNREELINCDRTGNLLERIRVLLPEKVTEQLIPAEFSAAALKIRGFISKAGSGSQNRKNQYIFVNNRPVTDKTVTHALIQGYHGFIMEKQFPCVFIFINIPLDMVDVNVHPNKREVRFRQAAALHDIIVKVVRDVLTDKNILPRLGKESDNGPEQLTQDGIYKNNKPFGGGYTFMSAPQNSGYAAEKTAQPLFWGKDDFSAKAQSPAFQQANNTYIIIPDEKGVLFIDQHAAHERIIFDEIKKQFDRKKVEKQKLLLPVTLHLDREQSLVLEEYKDFFQAAGFEVENFGENTYIVNTYPSVLDKADISEQLEKIISQIAELEINPKDQAQFSWFLASVACHCAVRANEKLSQEKAAALISRLWQTDAPYTCPHGRPTMINITWPELEKRFKRK